MKVMNALKSKRGYVNDFTMLHETAKSGVMLRNINNLRYSRTFEGKEITLFGQKVYMISESQTENNKYEIKVSEKKSIPFNQYLEENFELLDAGQNSINESKEIIREEIHHDYSEIYNFEEITRLLNKHKVLSFSIPFTIKNKDVFLDEPKIIGSIAINENKLKDCLINCSYLSDDSEELQIKYKNGILSEVIEEQISNAIGENSKNYKLNKGLVVINPQNKRGNKIVIFYHEENTNNVVRKHPVF